MLLFILLIVKVPGYTDPEIVRMQLRLIRQSSPAKRFAVVTGWSKILMQASYNQILKRTKDKWELGSSGLNCGDTVVQKLAKHLWLWVMPQKLFRTS